MGMQRVVAAALAAAVVGLSAASAAGQSRDYTSPASGSWDDPLNWEGRMVPRFDEIARIEPDFGLVVTGPAAPTPVRGMTIGARFSGIAELRLQPSGQLNIDQTLTVEARGKLRIDGVASVLGGVENSGEIELVNDAQLNGAGSATNGTLVNAGLLRGDGAVGNHVSNGAAGAIRVGGGEHLRFTGDEFISAGLIEAIGTPSALAEIDVRAPVVNQADSGLIVARNAIVRFNGGVTNQGSLGISFGVSDIFGDINNTGAIQISGGGQATFYDDLTQNGAMQVAKVGSTTSVAVLFGAFGGAGGFTGGGDVLALGDLRPGNSPDVVTYDGNLFLGGSTNTEIEIAGTAPGSFDKMIVTGDLALDGQLTVALLDGFTLDLNQRFLIADVGAALAGTFAGLGEGDLVGSFGGIDLFITYTAGDGNDVALATIPEPASAAIIALAGFGVLSQRRRTARHNPA